MQETCEETKEEPGGNLNEGNKCGQWIRRKYVKETHVINVHKEEICEEKNMR